MRIAFRSFIATLILGLLVTLPSAFSSTDTASESIRSTLIMKGSSPIIRLNNTSVTGDFFIQNTGNILNIVGATVNPNINFKSNGGATTILNLQADGLHSVAKIVFADASVMTTAGVGSASALSSNTDALTTADADANGSGAFKMLIGASEKARLDNSGNFGIGTTTPETLLDVAGNITTTSGYWTIKAVSSTDVVLRGNYKSSTDRLLTTTKGSAAIEFISDVNTGGNDTKIKFLMADPTAVAPSYVSHVELSPTSLHVLSNTVLNVDGTSFFNDVATFGANVVMSGNLSLPGSMLLSGGVIQFSDFSVLASGGYGARVHRTTNFSVSNNTYTCIPFDAEEYDLEAMHSIASNTDRVVAYRDGNYLVTAQVDWEAASGGYREATIERFTVAGSVTTVLQQAHLPAAATTASEVVYQPISAITHLTSGDYIRVCVQHTKGTAMNILGGAVGSVGNKSLVAIQYMGNQ